MVWDEYPWFFIQKRASHFLSNSKMWTFYFKKIKAQKYIFSLLTCLWFRFHWTHFDYHVHQQITPASFYKSPFVISCRHCIERSRNISMNVLTVSPSLCFVSGKECTDTSVSSLKNWTKNSCSKLEYDFMVLRAIAWTKCCGSLQGTCKYLGEH